MKAIVVGAGIGGLSAAIALRQAGWDVAVYERAPELVAMGAALSLWPNAVAALDRIGCGDALRAVAQPIDHVALARFDGRPIAGFQVSLIMPGRTGYLPTRTALQTLLVEGLGDVPLHLGKALVGHRVDAAGATLTFADGDEARADLLVAADGIWSTIATSLANTHPAHAGYGGVLALSDPVPGFPTTASGTEYWRPGERMGVFDLQGGRKYWFYMKNEAGPDESGAVTHDFVAGRMKDWAEPVRAAVSATPTERLIPFSVHAKPRPRLMAKGRLILIGDAAHAMEPNMGQGACQAIEDSVTLGALARTTPVDALAARYNTTRIARARLFVSMSRQGSQIAHRLPSALFAPACAIMRASFPLIGPVRLRQMYSLPQPAGTS